MKSCPFCGARTAGAFTHDDVESVGLPRTDGKPGVIWWFYVECGWCHAQGPLAETPKSAIEDWEMRNA